MRGTTRTVVTVAGISAVALLAAACGGGRRRQRPTRPLLARRAARSRSGAATPRTRSSPATPPRPVVATSSTPSIAKLVHYNPETAAPENDIAESIETDGQPELHRQAQVKGYKFHDGTEVKAKNFVDAWNYASYGPNAQSSGYFMEPIEGFGDLQCAGPNRRPVRRPSPKADKLTGLKVVDDHTFTMKTTEKVSNLPVRLGYTAFAPLPDVVLRRPEGLRREADRRRPVQGRLLDQEQPRSSPVEVRRLLRRVRRQGRQDHLQDLPGRRRRLQRRHRQQPRHHRRDPAERADRRQVQDGPARPQRPEGSRRHPDRHRSPPAKVDPNYADPKIRQAISMAIDRETIIKQIFNGTREPATGWVSPVVDGYKADQCGEFCTFDPAKAKAKLAEAGGFKGGKITLVLQRRRVAQGVDRGDLQLASSSALGVDCVATAGRRLRHLPHADRRRAR